MGVLSATGFLLDTGVAGSILILTLLVFAGGEGVELLECLNSLRKLSINS